MFIFQRVTIILPVPALPCPNQAPSLLMQRLGQVPVIYHQASCLPTRIHAASSLSTIMPQLDTSIWNICDMYTCASMHTCSQCTSKCPAYLCMIVPRPTPNKDHTHFSRDHCIAFLQMPTYPMRSGYSIFIVSTRVPLFSLPPPSPPPPPPHFSHALLFPILAEKIAHDAIM